MVNMIQIIGMLFFGLAAYEIWGWRGLPERLDFVWYLLAMAVLLGLAEIVRRMPTKT